jgi:hypothetical protein
MIKRASKRLVFSVPMQGPMGPRGPPGPAGAPVSVQSFPLGGAVDAHHPHDGGTAWRSTWRPYFPF